MNTMDSNNPNDRLEQATAARLAELRTMPVDTSALADRLRRQLPQPVAAKRRSFILLHPLRAAAAGFVIVAILLAAIISSSSGPAMASAEQMARMHDEIVAGHSGMVMKVSSLDAAAAALSERWPKAPSLPDMPEDHVMACCVHEIGRKKMACVSLTVDNVPITMAVAASADVKSPQGTDLVRDGVTYKVQSAQGVNMAMAERSGRWVCLMGRLPVDRLIELASKLRF